MAGETFRNKLRTKLKAAAEKNMKKELTEEQAEAIEGLADAIAEAVGSITIITGGIQVQGSPTAQANAAPITLGNVIL